MFLNIGLGFLIFLLPFSPHIPLQLFNRSFSIRLEDIIIPILLVIYLQELLLKKRRLTYSNLYIPIGAYFFIGLISTFLGYYVKHIISDPLYAACAILRSAEYYIIFFLTVNLLKTKKQLVNYLTVWLIAAILISVYGIFDAVCRISGPTGLYDGGWFLHQSNHMGGYLMISLVLALGLMDSTKVRAVKMLSLVAIPLIACAILFNFSRTTYLSTLAALFVFFAIKNRKLMILPAICAVVLFLVIPRIIPDTVLGRRLGNITNDIFSLRTQPVDQFDSMALHRAKLLEAFQDFSRDIVFGKGMGFYPLHVYDSQVSLVPVSGGIIGSVVFIWLLVQIFKTALRAYNLAGDVELKSLTRVFIAVYFGVLVHSITSTAFMIALIAYAFWFFAGVMVTALHLSRAQNN